MSGEGHFLPSKPEGFTERMQKRAAANLYEAYPVLAKLPEAVWDGLSAHYMGVEEAFIPDNKALNMYCSKASDVIRTALERHRFDMEPANKSDFSAFLRDPKRIDEYRAALGAKGVALKSKLSTSQLPQATKDSDAHAIEQFAAVLENLADRIDRAKPEKSKADQAFAL